MTHNCNPKCPNKNCEGGIITFDGQTGRVCKFCNPTPKIVKKRKLGSFVYIADESVCDKSFASYPKSRVFIVTGCNHNYVWVDSNSMGIEHKHISEPSRQQVSDHCASAYTKTERKRLDSIRVANEKVHVKFEGMLPVHEAMKLLKYNK